MWKKSKEIITCKAFDQISVLSIFFPTRMIISASNQRKIKTILILYQFIKTYNLLLLYATLLNICLIIIELIGHALIPELLIFFIFTAV